MWCVIVWKKRNYECHGKLHDCVPQKGTESTISEHRNIGTIARRPMRIWTKTRWKQCFLAKDCIVFSHRCRYRNWSQTAARILLSSTKNEAMIITNRTKLNAISARMRCHRYSRERLLIRSGSWAWLVGAASRVWSCFGVLWRCVCYGEWRCQMSSTRVSWSSSLSSLVFMSLSYGLLPLLLPLLEAILL